MGLYRPCSFGLSIAYSNDFREQMERRSRDLERHDREGNFDFELSLLDLHDAVDAALAADTENASSALQRGLDRLASCNDHLTALGEVLVRCRAELYEREGIDPADPLIGREPFFARIDYDALYRELAAHGAALPQRVFWDDVANRLRDGGARAGLRILDRSVRELQSDLRTFIGEVESVRRLPLLEMARALHGASRSAASVIMGFTRFVTTLTYLSTCCERASEMYDHERGADHRLVAAVYAR